MIEEKHIPVRYFLITFGVLIVIATIVKYALLCAPLDAVFFVIEFITFGIVLGLVYYLDYQIRMRKREIQKLSLNVETIKKEFSKRESDLLLKIMELEEREKEELKFSVNKEKTVSRIFQKLDFDKSIEDIAKVFLLALSRNFEIVLGVFYWYSKKEKRYNPIGRYAIDDELDIKPFIVSEGLCGQAVADKKILEVNELPEEYFSSISGLGSHVPVHLYFIPIQKDEEVIGLIEIGTFKPIEINRIWENINNKLIDLLKIS